MFTYQYENMKTPRLQDLLLNDDIKNHIAKSMKHKTHRCSIKKIIETIHKGKITLNDEQQKALSKSLVPILIKDKLPHISYGYLYLVVIERVSLKIGMTNGSTPMPRINAAVKGLRSRFNHDPTSEVTHVYVKPILGFEKGFCKATGVLIQESIVKNELIMVCEAQRGKRAPHYPKEYKPQFTEWMTHAKIKDVEEIAKKNGFYEYNNNVMTQIHP